MAFQHDYTRAMISFWEKMHSRGHSLIASRQGHMSSRLSAGDICPSHLDYRMSSRFVHSKITICFVFSTFHSLEESY